MDSYDPPLREIARSLEVAGLAEILELPDFAGLDQATVDLALGEFARFASEVIAPSNREGDRAGTTLDRVDGAVGTPPSFKHIYDRYVTSGWGALQFPERFGGGGFPSLVGLALQEMFASANVALSLNPVLTQSAIALLLRWGSDAQQATYVPKLLTGEWSGTMNLTEPDAGSDLGAVGTRAELAPDGRWRITGTKIFITWGEHDLTSNIVHFVLARCEGDPPGTKGLSLFLVPKFLADPDGTPQTRNRVRCTRLEEKLGIHASPTCEMAFDAATGELVGDRAGGLRAMFTMMNTARLSIGLEGPAIGERAYQHARAYAAQRRQGRTTHTAPPDRALIAEHPDVRRMLLDMRTRVLAARLLIYRAAAHGDLASHAPSADRREHHQALADLLTPIAKAWASDAGFAVASLGVQVLGGAGFVEESGMAQHLRDARIAPIYEGTNGIQAIDLVTRKLTRDDGRAVRTLLGAIASSIERLAANGSQQAAIEILNRAHGALAAATEWILASIAASPDDVLAGATTYLDLAGITIGAWLLAERAAIARPEDAAVATADSHFFATETVARAPGMVLPITSGARRLEYLG